MIKVIIEFTLSALIVVGTVAVIYFGYNGFEDAVYNPSLAHNELWHIFFGH